MADRRGTSLVSELLAAQHRDALIKMRGFPKCDNDVQYAEASHGPAKPIRRDGPLQDGKPGAVRDKNEKIILAPVPKQRVPRRKDQVEAKQKAENYEKNDGQFLNHTVKIILPFVFSQQSR